MINEVLDHLRRRATPARVVDVETEVCVCVALNKSQCHRAGASTGACDECRSFGWSDAMVLAEVDRPSHQGPSG